MSVSIASIRDTAKTLASTADAVATTARRTVSTESGDDRTGNECERKKWPSEFRDLAGKRENARADHHAGAHGDRAAERDGSRLIALVFVVLMLQCFSLLDCLLLSLPRYPPKSCKCAP